MTPSDTKSVFAFQLRIGLSVERLICIMGNAIFVVNARIKNIDPTRGGFGTGVGKSKK